MKITIPCTILWSLFCTLSAVANDVSEEDYDWKNDVTDSKRPNNMGAWAKRNEDDVAPFKMEGLKLFFSQKKKPTTTKTSGTTIASSYASKNCFLNTTDAAKTGTTSVGKTSTGSTKKRTTKAQKTTTNFSTSFASNISVDANQATTTWGSNVMASNEVSDSSLLVNNKTNSPDSYNMACNSLTACVTPTTTSNNAIFTSTLSTTGSLTTLKSSSSTTKKGKQNPTASSSSTSTSPTTKSKRKKKILKASGAELLHLNKTSRWKKLHKLAKLFKNADPQPSTSSVEQADILEESDLQSDLVTIKNANDSGEFVANSGDRENIKKQLYEKDQTRANTETNKLHDFPTVLYPIPTLVWNTSSTEAIDEISKLPRNYNNVQTAVKSLFSNNISTVLGTNSVDTFPNNAAEVHTINYEYQDTAQNEVEHDRDIKETAAIFTEVGKDIMKDDLDNVEEEGKDIHKAEINSVEDSGDDNLIDTSAMPINEYQVRKNIEKETNLLNHENGLKSITNLINKENTDNQQENKNTKNKEYKDNEQNVNSNDLNNSFSDKNKESFFDPTEESLSSKKEKYEKKSNSHEETLNEKLTQEEITQSRDDSYMFFIEKSTESYKTESISKEEKLSHTELNVDGEISKENYIQHSKESEVLKPNPVYFPNRKEDEFGFNMDSSQSNNETEFDVRNEIYTLKSYPSFFLHSPSSDFYKTGLNYNLQKIKSFLNYMKQNEGILNDFFGIPNTELYPIMKNDRYKNKMLNAEHQDIFHGEVSTSKEQSNLEIHQYNDASTNSDTENNVYGVENKKNVDETIISPSKKAESLFGNTIKNSDMQTVNYDLSEVKSGFEKLNNVEHLQHNTEWSSQINKSALTWNHYKLNNHVTITAKVLPISERTELLPFSYDIPNATIMPAGIPLSVNKNDPEWKDWIPINPIIKSSNSSYQNKSKSFKPSVYDSYNKIYPFFIPPKSDSSEHKLVTLSEENNTELINEDKTSYSRSDEKTSHTETWGEEHSFKKGTIEMDSKMSDKKNYLEHLTEQSFNEIKLMKERPVKNASDVFKHNKKKHQFSHILTGRKGFAKKKSSCLKNMEPSFDTEIHKDNIFPSLLSWDLLNGSIINQSKEFMPLNEYMSAGQPDAESISLIQRLLNNSASDIVPLSNATQDGNEFAAVKMSVVKIIHKLPSNVSKYKWITTEKSGQEETITRYSNGNFEIVQNKETNKNEDQNPSEGENFGPPKSNTSMTNQDGRNKQQSTGERIDAYENQIKKEGIQNLSLFYTDTPHKWPPKANKVINKPGTTSEFNDHDFQNKFATNVESKCKQLVHSEKSMLGSKNAQEKLERDKIAGVRPAKSWKEYGWKKEIQSVIDENYLQQAGEEIVNRVNGSTSNQLNYIVNHNLGHLDLDRSALVKYLTKERVGFFDKKGSPGNGRRNIKKRNVEKKKYTEKKMKSRELEYILQQNLPSLPLNKDEFINYMMTGMKKTTENSVDDRLSQYSKSRLQSVIDKNVKKPTNHRMKMERRLKSKGKNRQERWKNIPEYNLKKYDRIY